VVAPHRPGTTRRPCRHRSQRRTSIYTTPGDSYRGFAALALRDLPWHSAIDKPWQVGYAPPGWRHLTDHLTRLDFSVDELVAAGLARQSAAGRAYDTFRDRIMFPIRSADGNPVAFTGRTLQPDERIPKYLNTPNTAIFHKGQILYGLAEQADRFAAAAAPVLVEGPFDVIATWLAHPDQSGLPRAAPAACGTNLSPHLVAALVTLPGAAQHGITACFDPDPAGIAATERAPAVFSPDPVGVMVTGGLSLLHSGRYGANVLHRQAVHRVGPGLRSGVAAGRVGLAAG
jgi:DNA primase catalytic core